MVRGKFEGPVIREQGQTRLQATFVNGDKVGDWSEPGSTRTLASTPQKQSTETAEMQPTEEPVVERPSPSPSPTPSPVPPTLFPTPSPSPTATPSSSPTQSRRLSSSPTPTPAPSRSPSPSSPSSSPTAIPHGPDSKDRMIAEFKEQTESVLAQVRDATANFREIDRIDAVLNLPAPVSASVASLANRARDFRTKLGYEIAFHESKIETETVDALTVVDQVARSIAEENAPAARMTLLNFLKRYPEPPGDNQKPLWRYLTSALSLCNRLKNEAETHLERAQSLGSAGKKSEALREYREIYRIYPNPVTAKEIRQLEGQPR